MNTMVHDWPVLLETRPLASPGRTRLVSAGIVGLAHAVLGVALLWNNTTVRQNPQPPQAIMIDVLPPAPQERIAFAGPKQMSPDAPVVAVPDFVVDVPPDNAITVQPPPSAAVAPSPSGTARDTYFARLVAYLEARKRYPAEARRLHIEGVVQLRFRIDRMGNVLDYEIRGSSGRPILDDEAKALIARARPLPPIPPEWRDTELDLVVPVEFKLR